MMGNMKIAGTMTNEEVGKRLGEILYVCGFTDINLLNVQGQRVKGYDIILKMKNNREIKLKDALKTYQTNYVDFVERTHCATQLYLKLGMPYGDYEDITEHLSVEQIKRLDRRADRMKGEKTLVAVKDSEGNVVDARIEHEDVSYLVKIGELAQADSIVDRLPFEPEFEMRVNFRKLLQEKEEELQNGDSVFF